MKVAMVCPYSLAVPGGVQMQALGLARALRRLDVDATVLAPCDGPAPEPGVLDVGTTIGAPANGSVAPIAIGPAALSRSVRALRGGGYDVLHVHEPLVPGPSLLALLAKPAPIVATFHAAGESAAYRYLRPVLSRVARRIDVRCAVSKDAEALAAGALGGTYTPVWNGIDVDRHAAAEPWPDEGRPTVFFVGRHEPRKGLDVLLGAVEHLPADAAVWVAGEGPDTAALRDRFGGDARIQWLGRIDDDEKLRRLRGAHVLCAPALRGESFGIVLLEGMAAGTAVVASSIDGYRNVATDDVDALLVPPGDRAALGAALARALGDAGLRARLVEAGRRRADELSLDRLAATYVDLYRSVQ